MPSHVHIIASSNNVPLNEIIRDFKKFTSKSFVTATKNDIKSRREWLLKKFAFAAKRLKRGINYKVWKDGFHPIELTDNMMMDQKLEYTHQNPVVEGYVYKAVDWIYSSARFYICQEEDKSALQMIQ